MARPRTLGAMTTLVHSSLGHLVMRFVSLLRQDAQGCLASSRASSTLQYAEAQSNTHAQCCPAK
eukprot:4840421-Amphidinium_carterae.1